jgi:hypothetical protein
MTEGHHGDLRRDLRPTSRNGSARAADRERRARQPAGPRGDGHTGQPGGRKRETGAADQSRGPGPEPQT